MRRAYAAIIIVAAGWMLGWASYGVYTAARDHEAEVYYGSEVWE